MTLCVYSANVHNLSDCCLVHEIALCGHHYLFTWHFIYSGKYDAYVAKGEEEPKVVCLFVMVPTIKIVTYLSKIKYCNYPLKFALIIILNSSSEDHFTCRLGVCVLAGLK